MWLASCFPGCLLPFSYFLCLFFCCAVVFLYLFLCRLSVCISFPCMFPYWFLPVPLVLLAFFLCPTPGCRAYRDPDVEHAETRMSYNTLPYLRVFFPPSVVSFRAHAHILQCVPFSRLSILLKKNMFFNTFVNQRFIKMFKRNAKKFPDIFGLYVIKSYFCTRFREREQRCFDILTGTA